MRKRIFILAILTICISIFSWNASGVSNDMPETIATNLFSESHIDKDLYSFGSKEFEFSSPRTINNAGRIRNNIQLKRPFSPVSEGYEMVKDGKLVNKRSTFSFQLNFRRFPSGLSESNNHLISLNKLII